MHWEILDKKRQQLLKEIVNKIHIKDCYMAGGTALSLQLGLRESVDFDFFVKEPFNTHDLLYQLKLLYPQLRILQHDDATLDLDIGGIQVSYFHYPYPMVKNFVIDEDLPGLYMANPLDIAAMKISAIGGRGSRKDFYDLFQICKKMSLSSEVMHRLLTYKFGKNTDFSYMIMGLSYFENADKELLSNVIVDYDWNEVKDFFEIFSKEMQEICFQEWKKNRGMGQRAPVRKSGRAR